MNVGAVVAGLTAGASTALLALGVALIYKMDRTFNLAQGEFGTVAAFVAYLCIGQQVPYWLSLALGLAAAVVMALLVQALVVWPLRSVDRVTLLVATAAVALLATSVEALFVSSHTLLLPAPFVGTAFTVGGVAVTGTEVATFAVAAGAALVAGLTVSRTLPGRAVAAVAQDQEAAAVLGMPVRRLSVVVWGSAGLLGGLAGILLAPTQSISAGFVTTTGLVNALAAVVLGGAGSLAGACWGGLAVGLVEAVAFAELGSAVPGASELAVLAVLVLALVFRAQFRVAGRPA